MGLPGVSRREASLPSGCDPVGINGMSAVAHTVGTIRTFMRISSEGRQGVVGTGGESFRMKDARSKGGRPGPKKVCSRPEG